MGLVMVIVLMMGMLPILAWRASAAPPRTGQRLNLLDSCVTPVPEVTMPAGTSFWVGHGYAQPGWTDPSLDPLTYRRSQMLPTTYFELIVDGTVTQSMMQVTHSTDGACLNKTYITNFPEGLPVGDHSFDAFWYGDASGWGGPIGEPVLALHCGPLTVTFT